MGIREQLREEIEATRLAFHALAAELRPEDWHKPTPNPNWDVSIMMFHITVATNYLPADVAMIRRLNVVIYPPAFIFNPFTEFVTRNGARRYTLDTIPQAYDKANQQTLKALESVHDNEWYKSAIFPGYDPMLKGRMTIKDLFHYVSRHFELHAAEIRQSVAEKDQ